MNSAIYSTCDTPFAAWLIASGKLQYRGSESRGRKIYFRFEDPNGQGFDLSLEFETGALVRATSYFRALSSLHRTIRETGGAR